MDDSLKISGPMWLLQLWLNASLEDKLETRIPVNLIRFVEGTRLNLLTPDDKESSTTDAFLIRSLEHNILLHYLPFIHDIVA